MTVIDSGPRFRARNSLVIPFGFKRLLARFRQRRRAVRRHVVLSGLDAQLLYDIGLEPLDLHEALKVRQPPAMLLDAMRKQRTIRGGKK